MKKVLSAILIVVMLSALSLSVYAAPSPVNSGVISGISSMTDANGTELSAKLQEPDATVVADAKKLETIKDTLGSDYVSGMEVIDVKDVVVPEGTAFPAKITFAVPGVTTSTKGSFMHWTGSAWEKVATSFGNGTMTGTFNSLSPVAVVVDAETSTRIESIQSPSGNEPQSPQTSDPTVSTEAVMMISISCIVAAAILTAIYRKKAQSK